ncbi:MAG: hypothetical protein MJE77_44040 [Proteobacteria bacterium]|nr:hypothetical protein [Pseudomonadota bacterium]
MSDPGHRGELSTWEGAVSAADIDALAAEVAGGMFIGQRPGDFSLGRSLEEGATAWPSGRCFNPDVELRWWPAHQLGARNLLVLNKLPGGADLPGELTYRPRQLAAPRSQVRYLCIGEYDNTRSPAGSPLWWETRYGRAFAYLDSPPPASDLPGGRVYLCAFTYEFIDGHTQHRLLRFEHAGSEDSSP